MNKLKLLELFGGIGACSKALEKLGIDYEIVDYVEIDKYAVASYNAMHETNFKPQDITKWDKDIDVDLIMHGSPCQDFSLAGKQAGGDIGSGTRSSLMYETIRIVGKLRPKYIIWENVKNLISKKHIHNYEAYLNTMVALGYTNYYQVLNAKDYGIPQNRERIFTISIRNDIDKKYIFPQKKELKVKLKDMLDDEVDSKYYLSDKMMECFLSDGTGGYPRRERFLQNINRDNQDIGNTITTRAGSRPTDNFIVKNKVLKETLEQNEIEDGISYIDGFNRNIRKDDLSGTITTRINASNNTFLAIKNAAKKGYLEATEGDGVDISSRMQHHRGTVQKEIIQTIDCQGGNSKGVVTKKDTPNYIEWEEEGKFESDCRAYKDDKITGAIMTTPKNKIVTLGNYMPSNYDASRVVDNDGIAPTVRDNHGTITATNTSQSRIRKLTPKECWRLMGFEDKDFEKASKVNSNSQLYKQAGNSIVVNVLENIMRNLLMEASNEN